MIECLYNLLQDSSSTQKEKVVYSYVVFDGVKHPTLWAELNKSTLTYSTLFKEKNLQNKLKKIAPYLVKLDFSKESSLLQSKNILKYYEKEEMMFINCFLNFQEELEQLQELFYILNSKKQVEAYFRFYDSLIFETLLETNNKSLLEKLFFATQYILCGNNLKKESIMQYTSKDNVLNSQLVNLKNKKENL